MVTEWWSGFLENFVLSTAEYRASFRVVLYVGFQLSNRSQRKGLCSYLLNMKQSAFWERQNEYIFSNFRLKFVKCLIYSNSIDVNQCAEKWKNHRSQMNMSKIFFENCFINSYSHHFYHVAIYLYNIVEKTKIHQSYFVG